MIEFSVTDLEVLPDAQSTANARWRERNPERHREASNRAKARKREAYKNANPHSFIGVDGEGWTEHAMGMGRDNDRSNHVCDPVGCKHHYVLLCAGDSHLYTGRPLGAVEVLNWLCDLPTPKPNTFYVSYFFDYDVTMILRDMLQSARGRVRLEMILASAPGDPPVAWDEFLIWYCPKKYLKVKRIGDGNRVVAIHDTRAFFQCSFVKAITDAGIGTDDERAQVAAMKAQRSDFAFDQAAEIIEYCKLECRLLAALIADLRNKFEFVGMNGFPYEGPGPVAGRTLSAQLGAGQAKRWAQSVPAPVDDYARRAYYGGRFEVAACGPIAQRVYEYDIRSAYPDAMRSLPCLEHGEWRRGVHSDLYVAHVTWDAGPSRPGSMGPLPWRSPKGNIQFPMSCTGGGWYWSVELPDDAEVLDAWSYVSRCACTPFDWVEDMYDQRRSLEAVTKGSGIGLKLVLNSLYGKLAQRVGTAPFYNPVWAGLITAMTRAKIYDVYRNHPGKVIMFATDAVFLVESAPELPLSGRLGDWEQDGPYDSFCIFKPGVYFDGGTAKFKTRGVPKAEFTARADEFEMCAQMYLPQKHPNAERYGIRLERSNHLSLRQGMKRGPAWYDRIGNWIPQPSIESPDVRRKRIPHIEYIGNTAWTLPYRNRDEPTTPYDKGLADEIELLRIELDRVSEAAYDNVYD